MTKIDSENQQIQEAIELGKRNKTLLPKVKNWCKHLTIIDKSAGLIAEMYNLPMNQSISCSHTTGGSMGMNFEWIAKDFILENCLQCQFHKEVSKINYGREVIEQKKRLEESKARENKEILDKKNAFKQYIDKIKHKRKNKTSISELSILKIIDELEVNKTEKSKQILEASKLAPHFFNNISIDYLCLYLIDNDINDFIINIIYNISNTRNDFSDFTIERLLDASKNVFNDTISAVFLNILTEEYLIKNINLILHVINNLQYIHQIGDYDKIYSYPNTIDLILKLFQLDGNYLTERIKERISINNKEIRINTNGLLQDIIKKDCKLIVPFIDELILTLELEDDNYGDSADRATCKTLHKIFKIEPNLIIDKIIEKHLQLSKGALIELLRLCERIIIDGNIKDSQRLIPIIFSHILNKNEDIEVVERSIKTIKEISTQRFEIVQNNFEDIINLMLTIYERIKSFYYYKKELENKEISTFNPLQNLDFLQVNNLESKLNRNSEDLKSIIISCITQDLTKNNLKDILSITDNIKSKKDGKLKSIFISILIKSMNDQINIVEYLPHIYNHIFDIDSIDVRIEGVNFIIKILDDYPQLATQTLIDVIRVFLNDPERIIQKKALDAYGYIFENLPDQTNEEDLEIICKNLESSYIIIHKTVIMLSYKIFPFLSLEQKLRWYENLIAWEEIYFKEDDFYYSKELVSIILFYNKNINNKNQINFIKYLYKRYCNVQEYYVAIDFVRKLNEIVNEYADLNIFWLEQTLYFISKLKIDYRNEHDDIIEPFFNNLYNQTSEFVIENDKLILEFVNNRIEYEDYRTILRLLMVLLSFNLHELVSKYCILLKDNIPTVQSNSYVLNHIDLFYNITQQELDIKNENKRI